MDAKTRTMLRRELLNLQVREQKLEQTARRQTPPQWKANLEKKIPQKVYDGLVEAFAKGFSLVFRHGRRIIEKTYRKEEIRQAHLDRDAEIQTQGSKKGLKGMKNAARQADGFNLVATTAEGIALGALGVGLPDIVLFLSTLLKGIYETALHYGFEYESKGEQYFILKLMSAALKSGRAWGRENAQVEELLGKDAIAVSEEVFQEQLLSCAEAFAMDMLALKFIQGMPIVGIFGGAANPVYYHKVMKYVQLKYRKRYLLRQLKGQ